MKLGILTRILLMSCLLTGAILLSFNAVSQNQISRLLSPGDQLALQGSPVAPPGKYFASFQTEPILLDGDTFTRLELEFVVVDQFAQATGKLVTAGEDFRILAGGCSLFSNDTWVACDLWLANFALEARFNFAGAGFLNFWNVTEGGLAGSFEISLLEGAMLQ